MRQQSELQIEQRAFAYTPNNGGHPVACIHVLARLRPVFLILHDDGMLQPCRQRSKFRRNFKRSQRLANLVEGGRLLQPQRNAFQMAIAHRHTIAMRADAKARFNET